MRDALDPVIRQEQADMRFSGKTVFQVGHLGEAVCDVRDAVHPVARQG